MEYKVKKSYNWHCSDIKIAAESFINLQQFVKITSN